MSTSTKIQGTAEWEDKVGCFIRDGQLRTLLFPKRDLSTIHSLFDCILGGRLICFVFCTIAILMHIA